MMSNTSVHFKNKFEQAYQQLNARQQEAVNTIEGPVMVIAGPGTGKTQILACRIGKILKETDTAPQHILCLTYTEAGAIAMRKRLQQFIGPAAYQVNIGTFHSFCNQVIQDNLYLFDKHTLDPVSDLERTALLKQLIDAFPKNHPLKRYRGDVYFEAGNLQRLFSDMKREGWSSSYLIECIDRYLQDLPLRKDYIYQRKYKTFQAGDVKQDKINEEIEKMQKLRAAIFAFDDFNLLMQQHNRYDFDDMINWVIRVFETKPEILAKYHEQFLYILIDEYQDTSGTQNKIADLLTNYWEQPNLFIVGDDDQSIYRFQGANIENMLTQQRRFGNDLHKIVLTENYRSSPAILATAAAVIDNNTERLINQVEGLTKNLKASGLNAHIQEQPTIICYHSENEEMAGLVYATEALLDSGISHGSIGIIYKENKYGDVLADCFRKKNIAVYMRRDINLLDEIFIQQIIQLIQYVASELFIPYSGDEILFRLLHAKWFDIPPAAIAAETALSAAKKYSQATASLRSSLSEKASKPPQHLFDTGLHPQLKKASEIIEQLIADAVNMSLRKFFESLIHSTGIIGYIWKHPEKMKLLKILDSFFDFIKTETKRNPTLTVSGLAALLKLMQDEALRLPYNNATGNESGINLMTVHGSKGLEFEYVFVCGCSADYWENKRKNTKGYKIPDTVFSSSRPEETAAVEELRRLFYVAITRAKKNLQISYAHLKSDGKENEPTRFIAEIQEKIPTDISTTSIDNDVLSAFIATQFAPPMRPEIAASEKEWIQPLLDKFVMNVTALNNFLKCPLQFYFQNLVRIPAAKNEATEFGSAVHYALEKLFRRMQEDAAQAFPSVNIFIDDFGFYMSRHKESFTAEGYKRRMENGVEILTNYYEKHIPHCSKIVAIERSIKNIQIKGVPIKGKLDKLEFTGQEVNVVDYKTGDAEKGIKKLYPPNDKEPAGGDYWRQAVFYKLLVDNDVNRNWVVQSATFDFIEPDKKRGYIQQQLLISDADTTTVTAQITDAWQRIQAHDFYTGCGKADCTWCRFVKTNELAEHWHEMEDE